MSLGMALIACIQTISGSCSKISSAPGTNEVFIQGMAFDPPTITVAAGTSIKWTNKDGVGHTVTSTAGLFDSGIINTNSTYSRMFSTAGTFPYVCTIHPSMTATVIVH
jgi:plastocyanin